MKTSEYAKKIKELEDEIEELKETIEVLNEKNDELLEDICNEQDYNVTLWEVIAQLKGFKTK